MLKLVRAARRRLLYNELLAEGANAASAALVAFILLLLIGTQILDWRWALSIPLAAVAVGVYRVRRRLPDSYRVAQLVDRRLGFADAISTAFFFQRAEGPAARVSPEIRDLQFDRARILAEAADARQAVPFVMPRSVYPLAALALVASSLFALRYGITRRLDLKPPLAHLLQQTLYPEQRTQMARNRQPSDPETPFRDDPGAESSEPDQKGGDKASETPAAEPSDDPQSGQAEKKGGNNESQKNAESDQQSEGEQSEAADEQSGKDSRSGEGQKDAKSQAKQESASQQENGNSGDNSSLMSKVKDAMQNLLSRMKPQQNQQGGQQQSSGEKNNQGKSQQNGGKQQADKQGRESSGEQGESQEGQSGEQSQNSQDAQGKGAGKNDAQQASKQPGSGVGSHDGDKSLKQAADQAAMGKITELFGKRSANITGEATVEVQSTAQQLHTPYAQRGAQHTQGGAEIHRDEIPAALQSYVEHYFEQVRKQAAAAKK